jgi:hypothetical protein
MARRSPERQSGIALYTWWQFFARTKGIDPRLMYHVPNEGFGGRFGVIRGKLQKAQGTVSGVPDYIMDIPHGGYHGLRIELKTDDGVVSQAQKEMLALLSERGFMAVVARSTDEARSIIETYLKL